MSKAIVFIITFIALFFTSPASKALLSTSTLPQGIRSPSFRFGSIRNIDQKYYQDGNLMKIGEMNSVILDTPSLIKINPEVQKLVNVLNSFGGQNLGDELNLGVLHIQTNAEVNYFSPLFAYGITDSWSLALAVPVIKYTNTVLLHHENSNLAYYRKQFSGLNEELDKALSVDVKNAVNETLQQKGYRALESRNETFLGDLQLASLYKIFANDRNSLIHLAILGIPSGPQTNPDDLAGLNIFGRTTISNTLALSHRLGKNLSLMPYASYLINIPDQVSARIPEDEDDSLPGIESKQQVSRKIGNSFTVGSNIFYQLNDQWTFGVAFERSQKDQDHYQGTYGSRTDLLEKNTAGEADRVKCEISYSSVNSYLNQNAPLPLMVSLEIADTVSGKNIERQLSQEFNLVLFF